MRGMMSFPQTIFREYDIRGIVPDEIDEKFAYTLGQAFGTYMIERSKKVLAIGSDCRPSSPELKKALIAGLNSTGCDTIDVGVIPTPLLYYALYKLDVDGGVQITASHNPSEFNGFKLCDGKEALYGDAIRSFHTRMSKGEFATGKGHAQKYPNLMTDYLDEITRNIHMKQRRLKVVIDAGNGTAGPLAPELYRRLGCDVIELYTEMDGTFPNHHPDPVVPENLVDLIRTVKESGADLGIAFDGDSDRIGVVDENGKIIWGDRLLILYARDVLSRNPGAVIIYEVKCTMLLEEEIQKYGGTPLMWKAGHSLIKAKMKETGALLAGEMSGHMFFKERFYGYDDAIYAGARLLEILSQRDEPLSSLLADLPETYASPELRISCPDDIKFQVVHEIVNYYKTQTHLKVIDVDGARVEFQEGWGLIRASNTQPALVLRFEAKTRHALNTIKEHMVTRLKEIFESHRISTADFDHI